MMAIFQICGSGMELTHTGFLCWNCTGFATVTNEFCHASCLWSWGKGRRSYRWRWLCGACTVSVVHSYTTSFPCHYEIRLLVMFTCIPFGLWHFLSWVKCVLILWVLPFLLLAASRRHSRSTSALSTADSVGQSGEQALTAWICFLYVVLFYTILTFAVTCISQHLACASHRCEAFCSVLFNVAFSFWKFHLLNVFILCTSGTLWAVFEQRVIQGFLSSLVNWISWIS